MTRLTLREPERKSSSESSEELFVRQSNVISTWKLMVSFAVMLLAVRLK